MGRCMQLLHGLGCFAFDSDIPLPPVTLICHLTFPQCSRILFWLIEITVLLLLDFSGITNSNTFPVVPSTMKT
jgi:hypothetical protein